MRTFFCCITLSLLVASPTGTLARACPVDLSSLATQIANPELSSRLAVSFDALIQAQGSAEAALTLAQTQLADLESRRSQLPDGASDYEKSLFADGILIASKRVEGLECVLSEQ